MHVETLHNVIHQCRHGWWSSPHLRLFWLGRMISDNQEGIYCRLCGIEWAHEGTWPQTSALQKLLNMDVEDDAGARWHYVSHLLGSQRPGLEYSQVVRINDVSRPNVGFSQLGRLNPIIWWWSSYSPCQKWCLIKSDEVPTKVWTWQDELSLSGCNFSK